MKYAVLIFLSLFLQLSADVKLPVVIGDNMVVQRDIEAPIWGWADPGEEVTVSFSGKTLSTKADAEGNWSVKLPKQSANKTPQEMKIKGKNEIVLKNILVGDVWICSGQSNMEWPLSRCSKTAKDDAAAQKDNKNLRLFRIPKHIKSTKPEKDTIGKWSTTENSADCLSFSGCGFFFGVKLQKELDIPIGLIDTSWGGTPVDQWISNEAYESVLKQKRKGASIYNAMVAPLRPYGIKGAIWYQGESNRMNKYPSYFHKLDALISGWRKDFQVGDFPFYLVQIAPYNYNKKNKNATDNGFLCRNIWATQYKAADEIKNCGIVPTHDTLHGVINDIHPWDKKPVSERLANLALKKDYGKDVSWTGPKVASAKLESGKVVVSFSHIEKGLTTNDGKAPSYFEVAGEDKVFKAATAKIEGDKVVLESKEVSAPKYVRMGWEQTFVPNLADKNGWPAFQFSALEIK